MACNACEEGTIARQQAVVERVTADIDAEFGPAMKKQSVPAIRILSREELREAWVEAYLAEYRAQAGRRPVDLEGAAEYDAREARARAYLEKSVGNIDGFAKDGVIYINPNMYESGVAHEVLHTKRHEDFEDWLLRNADLNTAAQLDESMTEYFNAQLPTGPASHPSLRGPYGAGAKVVSDLRDQFLGGPDVGDELLRNAFFGGEVEPLTRQLEAAHPRGVSGAIDDYQRTVNGSR